MRDELDTYHRRSSHAGASSLDSSSVYALLTFDSSPDKGCTECISSDVTVPAVYSKDAISVSENMKCPKKETCNEADHVSGLVSAVPNHYIDAEFVRKKQLLASLPSPDSSKSVQSETSGNSSECLSVKEKVSVRNGLTSTGSGNAGLPARTDKTSLNNATTHAEQCHEVNCRRYSCGDQLTATWWRLLDHAASFSDLRGLPRSLSRFCCSTWRTFTGVKSPCIDVSRVDDTDPDESSRLSTNSSAGDRVTDHSVNPWWHKAVSADRRRLIDFGSDVECSSVCEESPAKQIVVDNVENQREIISGSQLLDIDYGGSYVLLRVNFRSKNCQKNVSNHNHSDCDILNDDSTGDPKVELPTNSSSSAILYGESVQPALCNLASQSDRSSGSSCLTRSDQFLQPHNGYVNLALGMQSHSLDRRLVKSLSNSSPHRHGQPAETSSVPNSANESAVPLESLTENVSCSVGKERLLSDSSLSSDEPPTNKSSWKSPNRLLQLIRCGSIKGRKQQQLPVMSTSVNVVNCSESPALLVSTDSVAAACSSSSSVSNQPPVNRLPSPDVPPPPVPDDTATSRLFQLCHSSDSERLPINVSLIDCDTQSSHEDLPFVKSCPAARKSDTLSSSYSAGDRQRCDTDSQSLKSTAQQVSSSIGGLLARMSSQRQRHGWFLFI